MISAIAGLHVHHPQKRLWTILGVADYGPIISLSLSENLGILIKKRKKEMNIESCLLMIFAELV